MKVGNSLMFQVFDKFPGNFGSPHFIEPIAVANFSLNNFRFPFLSPQISGNSLLLFGSCESLLCIDFKLAISKYDMAVNPIMLV